MQLFKAGEEFVGLKIKEPRGTKKRVAMGEKRECLSFKLLHTSPRTWVFQAGHTVRCHEIVVLSKAFS